MAEFFYLTTLLLLTTIYLFDLGSSNKRPSEMCRVLTKKAEDERGTFYYMNKTYRIKRVDSRNIAIQKQSETGNWKRVSYHGNSVKSLISGLLDLVMLEYTPNDDTLLESLEKLRLEHNTSLDRLERICNDFNIEDG